VLASTFDEPHQKELRMESASGTLGEEPKEPKKEPEVEIHGADVEIHEADTEVEVEIHGADTEAE
jgi:hypothetical protein